MFKLLLYTTLVLQTDSLPKDSVYNYNLNILFKQKAPQSINIQHFKYNYQQGFFCDFEDKLNKKSKSINLNIGVGEQ